MAECYGKGKDYFREVSSFSGDGSVVYMGRGGDEGNGSFENVMYL